jgi:hypothetical protein
MSMTSTEARRKSLRELRESTGTLFAKNNTPHKITCNTDTVTFELEPAGYDDSIRICPKECLNQPGFQRLWMKKSITISDDEEMENEITLLMGGQVEVSGPKPVQVQKQDGTWTEEAPTVTEPPTSRDMAVAVDTDPASRTYGQAVTAKCIIGGEAIFQTSKAIEAGEPPLCPDHLGESHRIVSTPAPDGTWTHQVTTVDKPRTTKEKS